MTNIRPYTKDLEDQVIEMILWSQNVEFGVPLTIGDQPDLRDVASFYQTGAGNFWVAVDGDRVVGSIALADLGDGDGALRKMFVRPEYRGQARGTAVALLEVLLTWGRAHGIMTLYLSTVDMLRAAHRFYEKHGFVAIPKESLPSSFQAMAVDTRFYRYDLVMSGAAGLAELFLRHAPPACAAVPPTSLEALLRSQWEQGRAAWPGVEVTAEVFVRHVAERLPDQPDIAAVLGSRRGEDLYLACACSLGQAQALARFEQHFLMQVPAYVHHLQPTAALVDEVQQLLRERLFVAAPGARSKINDYSGSGPLGGWVRVTALRIAVDLRRNRADQEARRGQGQLLLGRLARSEDNAEIAYVKARSRNSVEAALRDALHRLDPEARLALRLHFLDGLSYEQLARALGISRPTAVRRVKEARSAVLAEVTRLLGERLRLSPSEVRSLVGLVQSQLDEHIMQSLIEEADPQGGG